jgi:hypothetical protein
MNGLDFQSIFFLRNVMSKAVFVFVTEGNKEKRCQPASDFLGSKLLKCNSYSSGVSLNWIGGFKWLQVD